MPHTLKRLGALLFSVAIFGTRLGAAPAFIQQPAAVVNATSGQPAVFTAAASGTGTVRYQWRFLGAPIAGANDPSYTLSSARLGSAGFYDVVATDDTGSLVSTPSRLLVAPASGYTWAFASDLSFAPRFEMPGNVQALAPLPGGGCYVAGWFSTVGGIQRCSIYRMLADGSVDPAFRANVLGANTPIYGLVPQADGKVLISGGFTLIDGVACKGFARLNSDGSLDRAYAAAVGTGFDSTSLVMGLQSDGKLIAAGSFTSYNGTACARLARLNVDGTLDTTFAPPAVGAAIGSMRVQADDRIVLVGSFGAINGGTAQNIARLNRDGTPDSSFNPGTGFNGSAGRLAVLPDGKIVVWGSFTAFNGTTCPALVRLNADGSRDTAFAPTTVPSSSLSFAVQPDGKVLFGFFMGASGVVRLNVDGSPDTGFVGTTDGTRVDALAVGADGRIYAGGDFTTFAGVAAGMVVRLSAAGAVEGGATGPCLRPASPVRAVLQPDGKWLVAGLFTYVNGEYRRFIARLNADGTVDPTFTYTPSDYLERPCLALQGDGKLVVGARALYGGSVLGYVGIKRLGADGVQDPTFAVGKGFGSSSAMVMTLAIQSDGKIVAGGEFTTYQDIARNRIIRIGSDGLLDASFDPGTGFNDRVTAVVLQGDGKIVVAGAFTTYNGTTCNRLVRLNPDGSLDTTFAIGTGFNGAVEALAMRGGGKLVVGGAFTSFNGAVSNRIARLNPDGSPDASFTPGTGFNGTVTSLTLQYDGRFVAGGTFTSYNGIRCTSLVRLNGDGSFDPSFWAVGLRATYTGPELLWADDGRFLVTGMSAYTGAAGRLSLGMFAEHQLSYDEWMAQFDEVPLDQTDPMDTPAGDSVSNLLKFAMGVPPLGGADGALPSATTSAVAGQPLGVGLVFAQNPGTLGIRYALEVSSDLKTWTEVPGQIDAVDALPEGAPLVRLRELTPPAVSRRFGRLKIELVAP